MPKPSTVVTTTEESKDAGAALGVIITFVGGIVADYCIESAAREHNSKIKKDEQWSTWALRVMSAGLTTVLAAFTVGVVTTGFADSRKDEAFADGFKVGFWAGGVGAAGTAVVRAIADSIHPSPTP